LRYDGVAPIDDRMLFGSKRKKNNNPIFFFFLG